MPASRSPATISAAVLAFVSVMFASVMLFTVALSFFDLDFVTALSAVTTAVTNVGPGLGPTVGPAGNFSTLPDGAKVLLEHRHAARPARVLHRARGVQPRLLALSGNATKTLERQPLIG
jgi:hypothetical protein